MAEASAALEAESVPWSPGTMAGSHRKWPGFPQVFRKIMGKPWENDGKMMTIRVFWILYGTFCDFVVRAPGKK